jgi:segregation and condensation protein A
MERVKSIEERITEMTEAIKTRATLKFKEVITGARSKAEVVVSFLALLELVRRQVIKVTQHRGEDINIEKLAV